MNEKKFINNILQIVQKDNINNNHKRNKNASVGVGNSSIN